MADDSPVRELLEDDSFAENNLLAVGTSTLRHSATTDTLDSVILETSPLDDDLEDDALTMEPAESNNDGAQTFEAPENGGTVNREFSQKDEENMNNSNPITMNISSYFTTDVNNEKSMDPFSDIGDSFFDGVDPSQSTVEAGSPDFSDPGVNAEDLRQPVDVSMSELSSDAMYNESANNSSDIRQHSRTVEKEVCEHHEHLETRLSHEEPESVDFQVVPEDNGINIMEASLQVIDDKEDFEAFTAEADHEIEPDYSISPSNKFLTEKVAQLHLVDPIPIDPIGDSVPVSYDRQYSSSSLPSAPSPVQQPFQGAPIPPQLSPFTTPAHQPHLGSSPTNHADLAVGVSNEEDVQKVEVTESRSLQSSGGVSSAFQSMPDNIAEDPFSASLHMSETDRRYDAWLPSDNTRSILVTIATSVPGSFIPTQEQLSCPGIIVDEPQGDPVRDLVHRYMGEQEAIKRQILTVDSVTQDIDGLKKLLAGGCYRSAVELSGRLLTENGQGPDKVGEITQHTPQTLQLWFCRLSLMMKMKLYNVVESEVQAFQGMDTPDLYYEFYPHLYPGRKGSVVPFGMRVLHAELPHYLGRSQEALDRLHYLLAVAQKIIKNLDEGMSEDGSAVEIGEESRKVSRELWCNREKQILYIIGNTFLSIKDYESAMTVYEALLSKDPPSKPALFSGIGLMYLQMGNVEKATDCFKQAELLSDRTDRKTICRTFINRGLEAMCTNSFTEAYHCFKTAVENDPSNASAVNNMAVCSLYLGKLRDALKTLEVLVHENPSRNLHEGVLFNLCTLYELESSRALHKKQALLDLVSRHKGDGFPVACLKMA